MPASLGAPPTRARQLKEDGSTAKVIFLTVMHMDLQLVAAGVARRGFWLPRQRPAWRRTHRRVIHKVVNGEH